MSYWVSGSCTMPCTVYIYSSETGELLKSVAVSSGSYNEYISGNESTEVNVVAVPSDSNYKPEIITSVQTVSGAYSTHNVWNEKTSCPVSVHSMGHAEYKGKIYTIGGYYYGRREYVYAYDIANNSWQQRASMSGGLERLSAVEYDGKIYSYGGYNGVSYNKSLRVYTPDSNTWNYDYPSGPLNMVDHGSCVYDGKLYIICGRSGASTTTSNYKNTLLIYDIFSNSWSTKYAPFTGRYGVSSCLYGDKIYVYGGRTASGAVNETWEYNITTNTWTQKASGLRAILGSDAIEHNGKMYMFGGYNLTSYFLNLYIYDIKNNSWSYGANGADSKYLTSFDKYNGRIYMYGGWDGNYKNKMDEYII